MEQSQRDAILDNLNKLRAFDIVKFFKETSGENEKLKDQQIQGIQANEIIVLFERTTDTLLNRMQDYHWTVLPLEYSIPGIPGNQINSDIQQMSAGIESKNRQHFWQHLKMAMAYLMHFGIWHADFQYKSMLTDEELAKQKQQIKLIDAKMNVLNEKAETLIEIQAKRNDQIEKFLETKKAELIEIATNQVRANEELNNIINVKGKAQKAEGELIGLLSNQKSQLELIQKLLSSAQEDFKEKSTELNILKSDLQIDIKKAEKQIKSASDNNEFIESKREEIVRLTGMAADGTLGNKYEAREGKLAKNIPVWLSSMAFSVIGVAIWTTLVFTKFNTGLTDPWINFLANALKCVPAYVVMGFTFRQYNKERALQEEYGYKSAIAMTISAYADVLAKGASDKNDPRQSMILNAIKEVHASPQIHKERSDNLFAFNTKPLREAVGELSETLRDVTKAKNS